MRPLAALACAAFALTLFVAGCGGDSAQASSATAPRAPVAVAEPALQPPPPDPGLERYEREQLPGAMQSLDGVERAVWVSDTTLIVHLADTRAGDRAHLCPTVERYPSMRAIRLQLQPPVDSTAPVRFLQCKPY